jgi:hypothetical protein
MICNDYDLTMGNVTTELPGGMLVDTGKVAGRRVLHFHSLEEIIADAERLAAAERAGKLKRLGNWTLGQALGHLGSWNDFAYDGYPSKPPFWVKLLLRPMKKKFLTGPMRSGVQIPKVAGGTFAIDPMPTDEALEMFKRSIARLRSSPPPLPNPLFGQMTHEEWKNLATRHSELHLSFFKPE